MEKKLVFTQEQKEWIFNLFVLPKGGSREEAGYFTEVCESYGLNPLVKEIAFIRKELVPGVFEPSYITTRDGLLKAARADQNFVGAPMAAVVKEGDDFWLDPVNGMPHHRFGPKRGAIIGAWGMMKHKMFDPISVFVDFHEYMEANIHSESWRNNPSAMITKTAEIFVLRRQFPLSGLYCFEEMAIEDKVLQQPILAAANAPTEKSPRGRKNASLTVVSPKPESKTASAEAGVRANEAAGPVEKDSAQDDLSQKAANPEPSTAMAETAIVQDVNAAAHNADAANSEAGAAPFGVETLTTVQESTPVEMLAQEIVKPVGETTADRTLTVPEGYQTFRIAEKKEEMQKRLQTMYFRLTLKSDAETIKALATDQEVYNMISGVAEQTELLFRIVQENGFNMVKDVKVIGAA